MIVELFLFDLSARCISNSHFSSFWSNYSRYISFEQLGHEAFERTGNGEGPDFDPFRDGGFGFQDIFRNADVSPFPHFFIPCMAFVSLSSIYIIPYSLSLSMLKLDYISDELVGKVPLWWLMHDSLAMYAA